MKNPKHYCPGLVESTEQNRSVLAAQFALPELRQVADLGFELKFRRVNPSPLAVGDRGNPHQGPIRQRRLPVQESLVCCDELEPFQWGLHLVFEESYYQRFLHFAIPPLLFNYYTLFIESVKITLQIQYQISLGNHCS
jgi:hypothetical protein